MPPCEKSEALLKSPHRKKLCAKRDLILAYKETQPSQNSSRAQGPLSHQLNAATQVTTSKSSKRAVQLNPPM